MSFLKKLDKTAKKAGQKRKEWLAKNKSKTADQVIKEYRAKQAIKAPTTKPISGVKPLNK